MGIVVWTWAELLAFFVHHLLGVRPSPKLLTVRPRLLSGINKVDATVKLRGVDVELKLIRDDKQMAMVNGKHLPLKQGALSIPIPKSDTSIEIHI